MIGFILIADSIFSVGEMCVVERTVVFNTKTMTYKTPTRQQSFKANVEAPDNILGFR